MTPAWPALQGGLLALLAALLFGISTPLLQRAGVGVGPFTTAASLYAGAVIVGAPVAPDARGREGAVRRAHHSRAPRAGGAGGRAGRRGATAAAQALRWNHRLLIDAHVIWVWAVSIAPPSPA
jgi:drug/metabolite transporter (DMT)-like permease